MDTWSALCRCCLSPDSQLSFFDTNLSGVKEKFLELTNIEVKADDGLPQKLCADCLVILNSAYQFRKQCIKMDNELKLQLQALIKQEVDKIALAKQAAEDIELANDPMKQLEAIIKTEQIDDSNMNDDDYYYVLVIDDKDKENEDNEVIQIKKELIATDYEDTPIQTQEVSLPEETNFSNSIDSFLVSDKIPANVPATILENEESQENEHFEAMNINESLDSIPQETQINEAKIVETNTTSGVISSIPNAGNSYIKILGGDGTIYLKKNGNNVTYLQESQVVGEYTNEDDDQDTEEVIFCEGDESQFQILKCDGSELVIEYADDSQIATVFQQEDGTFLCDCGDQFETLEDYEKHQINTHTSTGENICKLCGKGFETPEILTGHMLLHEVLDLLIMCPFCNTLVKRNSLTQHIKFEHNNVKPRCSICLKTFANPNNLKRHMMIHNGIKEFECDICLKRFHQKITMQTHRLTHWNPLACRECDLVFNTKEAFNEHAESNECTKSKVTRVKEDLIKTVKQEITTNLGKLLGYACSLCKKMFSVESALEQHIENCHIVDPNDMLCSECGHVATTKKEMTSHMSTHRFVKNKNMKRFQCSICSKSCASQAMMIMHERVHTNERPFPCQLCSLRFKTKTHLRTHQLTHTREKRFGCSICMKFFALKGNLVVHLRTHTGERPYSCDICGEAFIDSKYLKKHKLKKHAIENIPNTRN